MDSLVVEVGSLNRLGSMRNALAISVLTGQRPKMVRKNTSQKIYQLAWALHECGPFVERWLLRGMSLCAASSFVVQNRQCAVLCKAGDDLLSQVFRVDPRGSCSVLVKGTAVQTTHFQSLLHSLKIPCGKTVPLGQYNL